MDGVDELSCRHANRNDRTRSDGRQHGSPSYPWWPPGCRERSDGRQGARVRRQGRGHGRRQRRRARPEPRGAARHLDHASGRRGRRQDRAVGAAALEGDIIIDGGNSHFTDDTRRARALAAKGIEYVDVGTSGGVWGLERGYCLMIGGNADATVTHLDSIFETLAPGMRRRRAPKAAAAISRRPSSGYLHCGSARRRPLREDGAQRHRIRDRWPPTPRAST